MGMFASSPLDVDDAGKQHKRNIFRSLYGNVHKTVIAGRAGIWIDSAVRKP